MALVYDTALIVEGDLVKVTGIQDTANLEADAELDRTELVLEAHRTIYRRVEQTFGVDAPASLSNADRLKGAEAWEVIKRLALGGYLGEKPTAEQCQAEVDREFGSFVPVFTDDADSASSKFGIPAVATMDSGWVYGPGGGRRYGQRTFKDFPRSW